jgi:hypothetical protein
MKHEVLTDDLVTFVIQGPTVPTNKYSVDVTTASVRAFFPGSRVIVSTWAGHPSISADEVVISHDPGSITDGGPHTINNINRQIVSTRAGLDRVRTPFAVKLRSDAVITGRGFLSLAAAFPLRSVHGRLFESRIVIPREFTRSPRALVPLGYHPSDLFQFGHTSDLQFYWNAPLVEAERLRSFILDSPPRRWFKMFDRFRYTTEQYLFLSALERKGFAQEFGNYAEISSGIIENSEHLLFNNFLPCEGEVLGVQHFKFMSRAQRSLAEDCLGLREFASWYVEQATERKPHGPLGDTAPDMPLTLRVERLGREVLKRSRILRNLYSVRYLNR